MREILFRGKRIDNGEWVEGGYVYSTDYYGDKCDRHLVIDGTTTDLEGYSEQFLVDPTTIGQYTGLTDKNGKKIFEGDVVESVFTHNSHLVCFGEHTYTDEYGSEEDACGWYDVSEQGNETPFGCPYTWAIVIGNIHDNPELVKGE